MWKQSDILWGPLTALIHAGQFVSLLNLEVQIQPTLQEVGFRPSPQSMSLHEDWVSNSSSYCYQWRFEGYTMYFQEVSYNSTKRYACTTWGSWLPLRAVCDLNCHSLCDSRVTEALLQLHTWYAGLEGVWNESYNLQVWCWKSTLSVDHVTCPVTVMWQNSCMKPSFVRGRGSVCS